MCMTYYFTKILFILLLCSSNYCICTCCLSFGSFYMDSVHMAAPQYPSPPLSLGFSSYGCSAVPQFFLVTYKYIPLYFPYFLSCALINRSLPNICYDKTQRQKIRPGRHELLRHNSHSRDETRKVSHANGYSARLHIKSFTAWI